jgi:tellurite resistance protein
MDGAVIHTPNASLAHLPLARFSAPMGVGGLGLAWREAGRGLGAPALVGEGLLLRPEG